MSESILSSEGNGRSSGNDGNGKVASKQWWQYFPIPSSWLVEAVETTETRIEIMEGNLPPSSSPPYRGRDEQGMDDTWSRYRRRYDDEQPPSPPQPPKIQVPFSVIVTVIIWSVAQLVAGVWWAATLQSNLEHEIQDRAKEESRLWDSIQTYRAEVGALRVDIARLGSNNNRRQKEEE